MAQPEDDHTPAPGTDAWITGQQPAGATLATLGTNDVDGGPTTLVSPVIDLSGYADPRISYWRWYHNSPPNGATPNTDIFEVFITSDGVNFEVVEILGNPNGIPDPHTEGGWIFHSFRVLDIPNISLTNQVQMHFVARDDPPGSIVEAGIDDFTYGDLCTTNPIGMSYCGPAVANSTGSPGVITADGSTLILSNRVVLTAAQLPPGEFGYFLVSRIQGNFMPPNSNGFICLSGDIGRYNANVGQGPTFSLLIDLNDLPTNAPGSQQTLPGERLNFQAWYRDIGGSNNFTDGLNITFQ